jgi:hypothetical protein
MKTIELNIDEKTLDHAMHIMESQHCTLEELIKVIIEELSISKFTKDGIIGMFTDVPELIDEVVESAMTDRETHTLR